MTMERIERLLQFLETSPADSFVQHALALEYVKLGDDETAKGLFQSILARDATYNGSYYHLAKLLERTGDEAGAIGVYETGMEQARAAGDNHALSELRSAYEDLTF
jgi:Tfp pilus assembly protein PilF